MPRPDKLQTAGRAFLLRLVATYGPTEAAAMLRDLADELEGLRDAEGDPEGPKCSSQICPS